MNEKPKLTEAQMNELYTLALHASSREKTFENWRAAGYVESLIDKARRMRYTWNDDSTRGELCDAYEAAYAELEEKNRQQYKYVSELEAKLGM